MGVIKKHDPKLGIFSESEESLHIAHTSEDDDVSSASDVVASASTSIRIRHHLLPIPMSASSGRKNIGKKRFRRFENVRHLETLIEDEEFQAVSIYDFIPDRCSGLKRVFESQEAREKWESFMASSEDQQQYIIGHGNGVKQTSAATPMTPDEAFRNIKTGLRNTLKRSQIPLGMLEYLETKLVEFFTNSPADIFISEHLSSFERLLLHGIAQYYCLRSLSFDSEPGNTRLVRISNPYEDFHQPPMLLVEFLVERRKRPVLHM